MRKFLFVTEMLTVKSEERIWNNEKSLGDSLCHAATGEIPARVFARRNFTRCDYKPGRRPDAPCSPS